MVQHIVQRCNDATQEAREEISASVVDAEERQSASFFTSHNKKVVHDFFKSVDNDRKRQCVFCKWTTVLNLTRMRYHILQVCHYVPSEVRQSFLKQEYADDSQYDTYCIVNVDDGDRKGLEVVSSNSLGHSDSAIVEEVVINPVEYINGVETDTYYEVQPVEQNLQDQPDDHQAMKAASDVEMEIALEDEDEEILSEEEPEDDHDKKPEIKYVNVSQTYYTLSKSNVPEKALPASKANPAKVPVTVTVKQENQMTKKSTNLPQTRMLSQKNQLRLREQKLRKFRTRLSMASSPRQTITTRKEGTRQTAPNVKKEDERPKMLASTMANTIHTSQDTKQPVASSTPLQNTPRQVRADSFIKQNVFFFCSEYKIDTSD
uniref:Uncharacterized protein n=1 Tax=Anopheles culicifacies TaxID=139723 RepID=A0A182M6H9_9DIPT